LIQDQRANFAVLERQRAVALALLVVLAAGAALALYPPGPLDRFGTLKGSDFSQFYVAARLAGSRLSDLYDWRAFGDELRRAVPGPDGLLYLSLYPPQLALLLKPLGRVDYQAALACWSLVSAAAYAVAAWLVARGSALGLARWTAALLFAAFPAFQQVLLYGQVSTLGVLAMAMAWTAWSGGHRLLAGVALGALAFKPPLLTVALAAAVIAPSPALWAGIAAGILGEVAAVAAVAGTAVWVDYSHAVGRILATPGAFEPKVSQMQSLRGFFDLAIGHGAASTVLYAACGAALLVLARRIASAGDRSMTFSAMSVVGLALDPHLYTYDLVILAVPLGVLAGWAVGRPEPRGSRGVLGAAWLLYWVPLVAPLPAAVRIQAATPAMVWLLWRLLQAARERSTPGPGSAPASHRPPGGPPSATPAGAPRS
jgi:hypothetical protein